MPHFRRFRRTQTRDLQTKPRVSLREENGRGRHARNPRGSGRKRGCRGKRRRRPRSWRANSILCFDEGASAGAKRRVKTASSASSYLLWRPRARRASSKSRAPFSSPDEKPTVPFLFPIHLLLASPSRNKIGHTRTHSMLSLSPLPCAMGNTSKNASLLSTVENASALSCSLLGTTARPRRLPAGGVPPAASARAPLPSVVTGRRRREGE